MAKPDRIIALDVGEKRIGVAIGDSQTKIAIPETTLENDEMFTENLAKVINKKQPISIVVGLPRNSEGQETKQSKYARVFAKSLNVFNLPIKFQDESLTSVEAKALLDMQQDKSYDKEQIDAKAAALILSDYLEENYARQ